MWRKQSDREEIVPVEPGVCLTIPLGTHFQFRSFGYEALAAVGVTMPPWPGEGEAIGVAGKWNPPRASTGMAPTDRLAGVDDYAIRGLRSVRAPVWESIWANVSAQGRRR